MWVKFPRREFNCTGLSGLRCFTWESMIDSSLCDGRELLRGQRLGNKSNTEML